VKVVFGRSSLVRDMNVLSGVAVGGVEELARRTEMCSGVNSVQDMQAGCEAFDFENQSEVFNAFR
jgi:hypothetical protein